MGCYNSAVIAAPLDRVWGQLRNFHDLKWAAGVVEKAEVVGDAMGDQIGAKRLLNGVFHETLHALDDVEHMLRYSIDDGPEAVSKDKVKGYVGVVRAFAITDTNETFVEWTSSWESGGEGARKFCDPIYQGLLAALKKHCAD